MKRINICIPEGYTIITEEKDNSLLISIIKEEEKGLWVPKNGDIITFGKSEDRRLIAIFKGMEEDGVFGAYTVVPASRRDALFYSTGWLFNNVRPATDKEKQILFSVLKEKGMAWNDKEKRIERIKIKK